jgi:hypothetical protein
MEETLQFLVMVEGPSERSSIVDALLREFPDAIRRKENSCDLRGNWIEVWQNSDFSPPRARDEHDEYLYFRYRVESTPLGKSISEADQIDLATGILAALRGSGWKAVLCANFEDAL